MEWKLADVARLSGGEIAVGDGALICSDPVWDSRRVTAGAIFVPLRGEQSDGHRFIADAKQSGAVASFVRRDFSGELPCGLAIVRVDDPLSALQNWARNYLQSLSLRVVGVTGSIGKTSTKEMIAAVLGERWRVGKTRGNLNTEMGLPLTVLQATADLDVLVLEMAMRGPGEIRELASVAPPHVAVITNVGESHIELLGSRENIAKAKGEILQFMRPDGVAVLNADDPLVVSQAQRAPGKIVWFGQSCSGRPDAVFADRVSDLGDRVQFVAHWQGQMRSVTIPSPGLHNLHNGLAAMAVGLTMGMSLEETAGGLLHYQPVDNRLRLVAGSGGVLLIDDTYNAGPASMRAALQVLMSYPTGQRRLAVLGDMLELGDVGPGAHRELGALVATLPLAGLYTVGRLAGLIAEEACRRGYPAERTYCFDSNQQAIRCLQQTLLPGDLLLVKGSRGMAMEEIVQAYAGQEGVKYEH